MSLFSKLGLTEEEKPEAKKEEKKSSSKPASITSTPTYSSPPPTSFAQAAGVTVESGEFNDYLQKVFTERNFPGPDYYEFVEGLKKMSNLPMDDKTKFLSLYAGLSAAGLTKEKLVETANKYIVIVQEQQTAFNAEVKNALNTEVASKEQSVQAFVNENQEIEKQMIALTEKKNKNAAEINRISQEVAEDRQTLALKSTSFDSAVKIFINQITDNIQKIQMYL